MHLKDEFQWELKFAIDNKIIEQVSLFNYLGNMISYEGELDIDNKLNKFLKITVVLNNVFRPQTKPLRKQDRWHLKGEIQRELKL